MMFVGIFLAGVVIIIQQWDDWKEYKNNTINEMIGEIWPDVQI